MGDKEDFLEERRKIAGKQIPREENPEAQAPGCPACSPGWALPLPLALPPAELSPAPLLDPMAHVLPPCPQVSLQLLEGKQHSCFLSVIITIPHPSLGTQAMMEKRWSAGREGSRAAWDSTAPTWEDSQSLLYVSVATRRQ